MCARNTSPAGPVAGVFAGLLAGVALLFGGAAPAMAATATFGGQTIQIIETAGSAADFYRTNGNRNRSPVPINDDGANFFIHQDTTTGIYSLGVVVNRDGDGTSGRFEGTITGLPATATVTLADDNLSEFNLTAPGTASFQFRFFGCCIDGGIISGIDPFSGSLSINVTRSQGLTGTYVLDATGTQLSLGSAPTVGSVFAIAANPEPAQWALMILGFVGVAWRLKSMRRSMGHALPPKAFPATA
ncbi:MAG: hypothetical protein AAFY84_03870 [Pseudomonadota bacterium]